MIVGFGGDRKHRVLGAAREPGRHSVNEGVGEHVRTRFHLGKRSPVKLRTLEIRTERRKLVSSAGPVFERANSPERSIQPFDLMSRRHPLSSIRAPIKTGFEKQIVLKALDDVPASSRRQFYQARFTSSSWRPCGSSSQSSSLRSSPSLPS